MSVGGAAAEGRAMQARLIARHDVASATAAFTFEPEHKFEFTPGQTCDITLPAPVAGDPRNATHTFSIASSPADLPWITIATRLTGSAFKRRLAELPPHGRVEFRGPSGDFRLHHDADRPAVLFAGGIGITPFRSILKDATERELPHRIALVYANSTPDRVAFLDDVRNFVQRNSHLRVIATITEPEAADDWPYDTGAIDADFIRQHLAHRDAAVHYIAGPPGFVTAVRSALDEAGIDADHVRFEEFDGY